MFYDLNIPWQPGDEQNMIRTLAFSYELGYNVVALNHTISGKLPTDLTNPILHSMKSTDLPCKLTTLRRVTVVLTESHQNARLAALAKEYDMLAVRPVDERTLQLACSSLDCDIISLDLTLRLPFFFRHKMLNEAIKTGKRFEICYCQGLLGSDPQARRNLISNATQLIRASRGRGLVISSEAKAGAVGLRGPWDSVNLAAVWGLGQERGYEAISRECRSVVVGAKLKKRGFRGVLDVLYGGKISALKPGENEANGSNSDGKRTKEHGTKRKADIPAIGPPSYTNISEQTISKGEAKRNAKKARTEGNARIHTRFPPVATASAENSEKPLAKGTEN